MHINAGDTAWMLTSTALVFFMMPGLALFYGGLVGAKNVVATMVQSFVAIGVISLLWVIVGYSLAFGSNHWGGVIGSLQYVMLRGVNGTPNSYAPTIPSLVYMAFQMEFAVITPALIAGAFCERMRFRAPTNKTILYRANPTVVPAHPFHVYISRAALPPRRSPHERPHSLHHPYQPRPLDHRLRPGFHDHHPTCSKPGRLARRPAWRRRPRLGRRHGHGPRPHGHRH